MLFTPRDWPGGAPEKSFTASFIELCSEKRLLRDHVWSNIEGESIRKSSESCGGGSSVAGIDTTAFP